MKTYMKDKLQVKIMPTRREMGAVAAQEIQDCILQLLKEKKSLRMIFAAAPSQNEVLASLVAYKDIDWSRIHAFHMDEYIGLQGEDLKQSFGTFLNDHIFGLVPFASVNLINALATDADAECARYAALLAEDKIDIVVMGIGENGHIAFNDPPVADFNDTKAVKPVALDEICRNQQVNDGCFARLDEVPKTAITLTVPTLFSGDHLFCIVPAKTKANAIKATLCHDINEKCPATVLRLHKSAVLYLDGDSSSLL